ncbi:M20 family metallopeptidase [Sinorhizobium meliloti]|uniref:Acetylornithine deacetylase n=1 Tax=Rhizobium meliloti TaxID=382 RepID=A0A2J0Z152_RHIML|nr:ArgE/DapE family deacylase [Sinorhizobium meliloti]PJR14225.1 acetylornithine deacetylase [Sinorhizobium meliloti]
MSDKISAVWKAVEEDRDYVVGLTRDIVRIPSVNPKFQADAAINREAEVQARIAEELDALGFRTDRWDVFPDRPNLTGEWDGSDEKSLILCGHVDVVPVGDRSKWHCDPFGGDIENGRIWGRGAIDMKAGVAACVAAARAVRHAGIKLDGRLAIHTVVDEEAGGFGAMDLVKRSRLARNAIVPEPTWGNIVPAEGGLTWVRVTIFGKQAHAGWRFNSIWPQPHVEGRLAPGVNAIELANRFLGALRDFETSRCRDNWHPLVPAGLATINPGVIRGGAGMGPDGTPAIMTNAAIIPDIVTIDLDYKFMPHENFEDVKAEFESFVHHFAAADAWMRDHPPSIEWDLFGLNSPPMNTPVDAPIVQSLTRHATAIQAKAPVIKGFEAVTDAAHYAGAGVVPVIYGPSGDGFHGDNECVEIESLIETTKVIAAAIVDNCGTI